MGEPSSNWPKHQSGLYTSNDYIKDLLALIEDKKYNNNVLNKKNEELEQKIKVLETNNNELILKEQQNKQIAINLRESINGLKNYIVKLELELKIGTQKIKTNTNEDIILFASESSTKSKGFPSKLVLHNTIEDKSFSIDCFGHNSDHTFINMEELKEKSDLSNFDAMVIEWKLLPLPVMDGFNEGLTDISEWHIKDNSIINIFPSKGFRNFWPKSGTVLKTAINGVIDYNMFERQAIYPSMASKTSKELDLQLKELEKDLQNSYVEDYDNTSEDHSKEL